MAENIYKAQPTASQAHIDRPLTEISIAYIQDQDDFIADKVFKPVKTDKQSNLYYIFKKEYFLQGGDELQVSEGSQTLGSGFGLETGSYICKVYGFHYKISDELRANADEGVNLDVTAVELVTSRILVTKEKVFADTAFVASAWTNNLTGAATAVANTNFVNWDAATSTPIQDIRNARMKVKKSTGFAPNEAVMSEQVFEVLIQHPTIIDRYKYTTNNVITVEMLAKLFDLDKIHIAKAIGVVDGAVEGNVQADDYDWIMKNGVLLLYVPKSASIMQPAAGYGFYWTSLAGAGSSDRGVAVKTYRMEHLRSDFVEALSAFEYKVVSQDLGFFFGNCLSNA